MPSLATTQPSSRTDQDAAARPSSSLWWVFPELRPVPLVGQRVIGRDADCDVRLTGTEVSRRHAELRTDGPIVAVRDLGSRNGVQVNGHSVTDAPLGTGDVIRCGEWLGVVTRDPPEGTSAAFGEIGPGWFGSGTLSAALAPARLVAADLAIAIQGETGTGKEGAARAIHVWSGRPGPLVAVNCATLPAELAEAELFGYRKGAFTGAAASSDGLFRSAEGGTLLLDEVLDLPLPLQAKLLRVLEERAVRPVGETREVPIDVRVIVACQEPLDAAVAARRFAPISRRAWRD